MLGTASGNPEIHDEFIASKAPDAKTREEEIAALGVEAVVEKTMTVFPRMARKDLAAPANPVLPGKENDRVPVLWAYQVKGFMKDACSALARVPETKSNKVKAYRKIIDGTIFVFPKAIEIETDKPITNLQRPLRAQTPQGERICLANSEMIEAGAVMRFEIVMLDDGVESLVREWLDYGELRGLLQWRNAGYGRFTWEEVK